MKSAPRELTCEAGTGEAGNRLIPRNVARTSRTRPHNDGSGFDRRRGKGGISCGTPCSGTATNVRVQYGSNNFSEDRFGPRKRPGSCQMTGGAAPATRSSGVVIETARLRMRAHRDDDLADLVALAGSWEIARWVGTIPHPYTQADGREWIPRFSACSISRIADHELD